MSLASRAYDQIRTEILTCELAPGQQIAQSALAERLGLGTTPVREALQRLAHEGLVQAFPRFGYLVSPISAGQVEQLYEYRLILETGIVRLAAVRAGNAELADLLASADFTYVYKDHHEYRRFLARNAEFHATIARLAGNPRMAEALTDLLAELTRIFHVGLDLRDSAEEMRAEHLALARALQARDAEDAARICAEQITRSQQRVLEALRRAGCEEYKA